jgi:hypothetical protein
MLLRHTIHFHWILLAALGEFFFTSPAEAVRLHQKFPCGYMEKPVQLIVPPPGNFKEAFPNSDLQVCRRFTADIQYAYYSIGHPVEGAHGVCHFAITRVSMGTDPDGSQHWKKDTSPYAVLGEWATVKLKESPCPVDESAYARISNVSDSDISDLWSFWESLRASPETLKFLTSDLTEDARKRTTRLEELLTTRRVRLDFLSRMSAGGRANARPPASNALLSSDPRRLIYNIALDGTESLDVFSLGLEREGAGFKLVDYSDGLAH